MNISQCKLCSTSNNNHENCKYDFFDILKNIFQTEIDDIKTQLNNKIEECKNLQECNVKLVKENESLALNIKRLENDCLSDRKKYELAPDTPPTQSMSLNRAMLADSSNDDSYKENMSDKKSNSEEFSSPEDKKPKFLDIPRRKKIPFNIKSPNSSEPKWISKNPKNKSSIGFSFIQPMHKTDTIETGNSPKSKSTISKISLSKTSKKFKQTRLAFNKSTTNLDNTALRRLESNDETYCDDVIMPTPQNTTTRVRSSTSSSSKSSSTSPENKIFDFALSPHANETYKKPKLSVENDPPPPIAANDSVEFLPVDEEIIFVSDSTNVNNFSESEESNNSNDLLERYSMEFGKEEKNPVREIKLVKTNVLQNNNRLNVYKEFQITSPIRKKSEKAKRPGFDCPDCEQYYQLIGISMSDTEIQNRKNECSKHRKYQRLHQTPEGFWNPVFTPTQN